MQVEPKAQVSVDPSSLAPKEEAFDIRLKGATVLFQTFLHNLETISLLPDFHIFWLKFIGSMERSAILSYTYNLILFCNSPVKTLSAKKKTSRAHVVRHMKEDKVGASDHFTVLCPDSVPHYVHFPKLARFSFFYDSI